MSESTHVKMPHCWKSHVTVHLKYDLNLNYLLTYVAETKVILREIYSILIGNDSHR